MGPTTSLGPTVIPTPLIPEHNAVTYRGSQPSTQPLHQRYLLRRFPLSPLLVDSAQPTTAIFFKILLLI